MLTLSGSSPAALIRGRVMSLNRSSVSVSRRIDGPADSLSCAAAGCHADMTSSSRVIIRRTKRATGKFIAGRLPFSRVNERLKTANEQTHAAELTKGPLPPAAATRSPALGRCIVVGCRKIGRLDRLGYGLCPAFAGAFARGLDRCRVLSGLRGCGLDRRGFSKRNLYFGR